MTTDASFYGDALRTNSPTPQRASPLRIDGTGNLVDSPHGTERPMPQSPVPSKEFALTLPDKFGMPP